MNERIFGKIFKCTPHDGFLDLDILAGNQQLLVLGAVLHSSDKLSQYFCRDDTTLVVVVVVVVFIQSCGYKTK